MWRTIPARTIPSIRLGIPREALILTFDPEDGLSIEAVSLRTIAHNHPVQNRMVTAGSSSWLATIV